MRGVSERTQSEGANDEHFNTTTKMEEKKKELEFKIENAWAYAAEAINQRNVGLLLKNVMILRNLKKRYEDLEYETV